MTRLSLIDGPVSLTVDEDGIFITVRGQHLALGVDDLRALSRACRAAIGVEDDARAAAEVSP